MKSLINDKAATDEHSLTKSGLKDDPTFYYFLVRFRWLVLVEEIISPYLCLVIGEVLHVCNFKVREVIY